MTTNEAEFPQGAALVIGGSGGVGAVICEELARAGCDVALTYRGNEARAKEVVAQVEALGRAAAAHQLDIADAGQVAAVVDAVAAAGRVHTVVVAAGSDIAQVHISEMTTEQWREVVDADLNGFYHIVHATLPRLREGGGGSYVHISSAGLQKWPERDALSVAPKAAIESLLQGIAKEEGRHGVRANSVLLGVIETGIFLRLLEEGVFDEEWQQAVKRGLCLPRWGKAVDIANAVVFLASNRAAYVTGQMLAVDGGYGV